MYDASHRRIAGRALETRPDYPALETLDEATRLESALRRAGLRVPLLRRRNRLFAGGCAVVLGAARADFHAARQCLHRALDLRLPVSVHVEPAGCEIADAELIDTLEAAFRLPGAPGILLSVDWEDRPLLEQTGQACLPGGIDRYCFIDRADSTVLPGGTEGWRPALHAGVRSCCPLLPAETSQALLPGNGLAIPAGTAWLPITLDLRQFLDDAGTLRRARLRRALCTAVDAGDALLDLLSWCSAEQAEDARLNRRLAIGLTGIGDVAAARSLDPASLDCLREFDTLVDEIHTVLWHRSAHLAAEKGAVPVLTERAPSARWQDESHRQAWACRWQQAVANVQVRNRNLLAMSPWSLLSSSDRTLRCADLMPLIAHADAVGFAAPARSNLAQRVDLKCFHERLRAQVQRFNAMTLIAGNA